MLVLCVMLALLVSVGYAGPDGSAGTADPIDQRSSVGWKASTVAKILNDAFMCSVISASSQGSNA